MGIWAGLPNHIEAIIDLENAADLDHAYTLSLDIETPILPALEASLPRAMNSIMNLILVGSFSINLNLHTTPLCLLGPASTIGIFPVIHQCLGSPTHHIQGASAPPIQTFYSPCNYCMTHTVCLQYLPSLQGNDKQMTDAEAEEEEMKDSACPRIFTWF